MPINHSSKYADLTDEQYQLIGKVIIEFSNLDFLLGNLLSRMLIMPEFLGRTYNDLLTTSKIVEGIENAIDIHKNRYSYKLIDQQTIQEIQNIIGQIKGLKSIRNKFAHYCWSRWDDSKIFGTKLSGRLPKPKNPDVDSMTITNDDLKREYKKAYSSVEKLESIIKNIPELEEDRNLPSKLRFTTLNNKK
jgi:hypothetical protein